MKSQGELWVMWCSLLATGFNFVRVSCFYFPSNSKCQVSRGRCAFSPVRSQAPAPVLPVHLAARARTVYAPLEMTDSTDSGWQALKHRRTRAHKYSYWQSASHTDRLTSQRDKRLNHLLSSYNNPHPFGWTGSYWCCFHVHKSPITYELLNPLAVSFHELFIAVLMLMRLSPRTRQNEPEVASAWMTDAPFHI